MRDKYKGNANKQQSKKREQAMKQWVESRQQAKMVKK